MGSDDKLSTSTANPHPVYFLDEVFCHDTADAHSLAIMVTACVLVVTAVAGLACSAAVDEIKGVKGDFGSYSPFKVFVMLCLSFLA